MGDWKRGMKTAACSAGFGVLRTPGKQLRLLKN
jgi:hypothetical protein